MGSSNCIAKKKDRESLFLSFWLNNDILFHIDSKISKFSSTSDFANTKLNGVPKTSSLKEENEHGFKEIRLIEDDLELKKKRDLLENINVFIRKITIILIFSQENYQKIPNFMNEEKNAFGEQEEQSYGTVGLANIGNTCFMNTGRYNFSFKNFLFLSF